MRLLFVLVLCIAASNAVPRNLQRIVGGSVTTVDQYPTIASLLYAWNWSTYWQTCGGTIINVKSILTAAHCPDFDAVSQWRARVGSTYANSGGIVHVLDTFIIHPNYDRWTLDSDIAICRTQEGIVYNNYVQPAPLAGSGYNLRDDEPVMAAGWGAIQAGGPASEQLRHVQVWTVNQETCTNRYASLGNIVTENMLCSGWLDVGGRDQCQGDSGGPLYHNSIVVGVCSWGMGCAQPFFPGVNVRVSRFTTWIQANA